MISLAPLETSFDISLIHKTYNFYQDLYICARRLPKQDRHTLGQKSQQLTIEILELLFAANSESGAARFALQKQVDLKLKILKTIIRLCYDVRAIDESRYLSLEKKIVEIGRMLGGWIKKTDKNDIRKPA